MESNDKHNTFGGNINENIEDEPPSLTGDCPKPVL